MSRLYKIRTPNPDRCKHPGEQLVKHMQVTINNNVVHDEMYFDDECDLLVHVGKNDPDQFSWYYLTYLMSFSREADKKAVWNCLVCEFDVGSRIGDLLRS
jgi:hypothetical protein